MDPMGLFIQMIMVYTNRETFISFSLSVCKTDLFYCTGQDFQYDLSESDESGYFILF